MRRNYPRAHGFSRPCYRPMSTRFFTHYPWSAKIFAGRGDMVYSKGGTCDFPLRLVETGKAVPLFKEALEYALIEEKNQENNKLYENDMVDILIKTMSG